MRQTLRCPGGRTHGAGGTEAPFFGRPPARPRPRPEPRHPRWPGRTLCRRSSYLVGYGLSRPRNGGTKLKAENRRRSSCLSRRKRGRANARRRKRDAQSGYRSARSGRWGTDASAGRRTVHRGPRSSKTARNGSNPTRQAAGLGTGHSGAVADLAETVRIFGIFRGLTALTAGSSLMILAGLEARLSNGAPERIRTSDPQIRSLVLYPAELRAPT